MVRGGYFGHSRPILEGHGEDVVTSLLLELIAIAKAFPTVVLHDVPFLNMERLPEVWLLFGSLHAGFAVHKLVNFGLQKGPRHPKSVRLNRLRRSHI